MQHRAVRLAIGCAAVIAMMTGASLLAHEGPPYPIFSNRVAGNYQVSLWADPDATDDGSAAARFWVTLNPAQKGQPLPSDTEIRISIWPLDAPASVKTAKAEPVEREPSRWFAAFAIGNEGRYGVRASIDGPLGPSEVETVVNAADNRRPRPLTIILFILPFLLIGFVWVKLVLVRRGGRTAHVVRRPTSS